MIFLQRMVLTPIHSPQDRGSNPKENHALDDYLLCVDTVKSAKYHLDQAYLFGYSWLLLISFHRTTEFNIWLKALRDPIGKARIITRIRSAEQGNFGDCEAVGDGITEMRIHCGPGYRLYYTRKGQSIYLLLCGGNNATQKQDIRRAKSLAKSMEQ